MFTKPRPDSEPSPGYLILEIEEKRRSHDEAAATIALKTIYQSEFKRIDGSESDIKTPLLENTQLENTQQVILTILQQERESRRQHTEQLAARRAEQRRVKQAPLAALKQEQKEINESIFLLEKGIRKRKLPIQLVMSSIALGTAVYLLRNWLYVDPQARQQLYPELYNQLESQLSELSAEYPSLQGASQEAFYNLSQTNFNFLVDGYDYPQSEQCSDRGVDGWPTYGTPCEGNYLWYWPCAIQSQTLSLNPCGDAISDWNGVVVGPDPCPPLIDRWCSTFASFSSNIQANQTASYNFQHFNDYANQIINNNLYGWMGNMLTFYAIFITFGEAAPLIIMAITFLTHALTNCLSSPRLCFNLSEEDRNTVSVTATTYDIDNLPDSYPVTLQRFKDRRHDIARLIEEEKKPEDSRHAIFMGRTLKPGAVPPPISKLFNHPLAEPKLIHKIFDLAGIGISAEIEKSVNEPARHALELGGHVKSASIPILNERRDRINPLYSFLNRLKAEKWGEVIKRDQDGNTESKMSHRVAREKFEKGAPAYNKQEVLENIYEYAGIARKR